MGQYTVTYDCEYDVGDLVVFEKNNLLMVGIVEGFYVDTSACESIWYNIRINKNEVFTYSNGGDVAEWEIRGVIKDADIAESVKRFIAGKDEG